MHQDDLCPGCSCTQDKKQETRDKRETEDKTAEDKFTLGSVH